MEEFDPKIHSFLQNKTITVQPDKSSLSFADISKCLLHTKSNIKSSEELQNLKLAPFVNQSWKNDARKTIENVDKSNRDSVGSPSIILDDFEPDLPHDRITCESGKQEMKETRKKGAVSKLYTRTLQYPPCYVCGGKASGDHYGVNSCEACKGFFRRFLLRKKGVYTCKSGGNCEISSIKRGMCAGCRLQKCLNAGMSKGRCKLGRYSAEKRTEKIRTVKEMHDGLTFVDADFNLVCDQSANCDPDCDLITKTLAGLTINNTSIQETFSDNLIPVLTKAKNSMSPFGNKINVNNPDEVKKALRDYNEEFQCKRQLYGEMRAVPKEDFTKLYQMYGIDVDNRLKDIHECVMELDSDVTEMCNFAKHIPFFSKLPLADQSNLLKAGCMDMYMILACNGYDPVLGIVLDKNKAFHVTEMDKIFSQEYVQEILACTLKCQKLQLSEPEQVLVMALSLFFTDKCSLKNPNLVEKIQLSLTFMLKRHLEKNSPKVCRKRFTDILEFLTYIRKAFGLYTKEMAEICRDEIYGKEFPFLKDFLPKEEGGKQSSVNSFNRSF